MGYYDDQVTTTLESFEPTGVDFFAVVAKTRMLNAAAALMGTATVVLATIFGYAIYLVAR